MMSKIPILILTGPTAVGKTDLSVKLAEILNAEIISADATQIYKKMDIGSAKITHREMKGVPHHLIDILNPDDEFSVSEYGDLAKKCIEDIHNRGKFPIITGGTGLYLNSILYKMNFGNSNSDERLRLELNELLNNKGIDYMHNLLKSYSEEVANKIHKNNTKRVIRAIEIFKLGGELGDFSKDLELNEKYDAKIVVLNRNRKLLYDRINYRVDLMFENGLIEEVKSLVDEGFSKDLVSMKAIGYKEIIDYLNGITTLEESKSIIKQNSRRYAKRQITWFKRYKDAFWIDLDNTKNIDEQIDIIMNLLKER
ncbi:tRNA (adenosine(37)-N6)-dimethylallyltransferase MiaA [Peptostreptococcus canis]|uniref:tRNA dimethylallyltransferase n=1 Tax=Peptostreptococcus canis TaxID=1159213 RepID=A0ABR6TL43_9FIRM|nr:tRNA (adenosine(37)-N6)-dimethylallyltransferase MiaA [Peptostreptococcus canis]MBC2575711.1 tRNA (adenosine(37)-N6)-dimethylallyltransferase MiaA [Peptostreptococcus canis]